MDEILFSLLEQTPVVIALGLGVFVTWRDKHKAMDAAEAERKAHRKEIKDLQTMQSKELKELNALVRKHEKEHLQAIEALTDALSKLNSNE